MIGKKLAHYEILELIGKGGMGEVYRAHDSKLGREVAVKLLPPEFARDAERLARFRREARTLAGLNHANVAAIYDLDDYEGQTFLTMELVEGSDLAERLTQGPLTIGETVEIARQIAEGMEEAHEKGIIHRDLKPANVKITPEGRVKILDFGLARAYLDEPTDATNLAHSPTITQNFTAAGTILGTAAYMSPEQARGRALDSRTDIWSFGCVLFEMLCGSATFAGDTVTDVLAGIVAREPSWDLLPEDTPAQVRSLLWRCLQKDPRQRLRHIGEASFYLNPPDPAMSSAMSAFDAAPTAEAPSPRSRWWAPTLIGLAAGTALGFFGLRSFSDEGRSETRHAVARLSIPVGDLKPFSLRAWSALSISRDGQTMAYSCTPDGVQSFGDQILLAVRPLSSQQIRTIPGINRSTAPSFSPDGTQLAYYDFSRRVVMRVRLDGGSPAQITSAPHGFSGMHWYEDESVVMTGAGREGLFRINVLSSETEKLLEVDESRGEASFSRPLVLIDHRLVLFTVYYANDNREPLLACMDLDTKVRTDLGVGESAIGLLPSGELAYLRESSILSQRLEQAGPALVGASKMLVDDCGPNVALSPSGTLVYMSAGTGGEGAWSGRVVVVDDEGNVEAAIDEAQEYARYPRISPDGRYLAITTGPGGQGTIWRHDLTRQSPPINLTFQDHNVFPVWSPDGSQILFQRSNQGATGGTLQIIASDGSQMESRQIEAEELGVGGIQPGSWLTNGKAVFTRLASPETANDILEIDLGENLAVQPLVVTRFAEGNTVMVSPDEKWMAYTSDRSGESEIWVQGYPSGPAQRISSGGGLEPVWSRDGNRLYYQSGRRIMVVDVSYGGASEIGFSQARTFYEGPFISHEPLTPRTYDAHPDGRLILIERIDKNESEVSISVVLNWFEEFREGED